ncbi:hypothetical protein OIU78_001305 [Salix suchowensis]|nr:hypothetical protein OIU78_001305 [Salix suchowensis]
MKKKKRDTKRHNIPAAVLHWMLFTRYYLLQFPLLSAFFGFLLLLFASFAFLSPLPPIINHHNHSLQLKNGAKAEESTLSKETSSFRVPRSGWRLGRHLWSSRSSKFYYGCSNASESFETADRRKNSDRYLLIATSGGLNQQRTGITDGVVAAYILNATLVVPKLDQKSFWNDSSDFAQIFDVDWFISFLSKDVTIIKQLHGKGGKALNPYRMRVPRKCTPTCYLTKVLPVLNKKHAVQLGKFDYRLSNRFEPDMLAFSGCYFGGGEKERMELGKIRRRWKSLHTSNPDKERRQGRCPLTPEEVGLMLRALGFGSDVHLYVASGEVYGGEETLAPLKALFPNFHSKETLASMRELAPFSSFSSRMAALDFIVCDESDVFSTNNNGNMAKILAGRRRYFGHKPTIRPNAKKLYKLFMSRHNKTWEEFASRVRTHQIGFMGEPNEVKPGRGEFHENPSSCICEDSAAKARAGLTLTPQNLLDESHKNGKENINKNETSDVTDEHSIEDDQDLTDMDYLDRETAIKGKGLPGEMLLEEFFSD